MVTETSLKTHSSSTPHIPLHLLTISGRAGERESLWTTTPRITQPAWAPGVSGRCSLNKQTKTPNFQALGLQHSLDLYSKHMNPLETVSYLTMFLELRLATARGEGSVSPPPQARGPQPVKVGRGGRMGAPRPVTYFHTALAGLRSPKGSPKEARGTNRAVRPGAPFRELIHVFCVFGPLAFKRGKQGSRDPTGSSLLQGELQRVEPHLWFERGLLGSRCSAGLGLFFSPSL